jgi:glyoxylate carboligase
MRVLYAFLLPVSAAAQSKACVTSKKTRRISMKVTFQHVWVDTISAPVAAWISDVTNCTAVALGLRIRCRGKQSEIACGMEWNRQ